MIYSWICTFSVGSLLKYAVMKIFQRIKTFKTIVKVTITPDEKDEKEHDYYVSKNKKGTAEEGGPDTRK